METPTTNAPSTIGARPLPPEDPGFPAAGSRRDLVLLGALAVVAILVRLLPVLRGGGLFGSMTYDDGVYFGAAVALVDGRIPYRDFLLLHPPGVLFLLAPFAALGGMLGDANAFAFARFGFMVLGAVNVILVARVASRFGRVAALAAAALYVVWQVAANVERTTWLIAPQNTVLLLVLLALAGPGRGPIPATLGRRRLALAGLLLGVLVGMQLWGVVPLAVVVAWLALSGGSIGARVRRVALVGGAAAVAVLLIWGPFLVASEGAMLRYVVFDQAGRVLSRSGVVQRLRYIEGVANRHAGGPHIPTPLVVASFLAVSAGIAWAAVRRPAMRLWAALLAAQVVALMFAPPFAHYAGWLAPAAALCIGGLVQEGSAALATRPRLRTTFRAGYVVALGLLLVVSTFRPIGARLNVAYLRGALADEHCVTADEPTLLIETNTLSRDLTDGCPVMLDPTGLGYDVDHAIARSRRVNPAYQAAMATYYGDSDAALFDRMHGDQFRPITLATIRRNLPDDGRRGAITVMIDADR